MKRKFGFYNDLANLADKFKLFIKKLYVFAFFWGWIAAISYGVAILIPVWLRKFGLSFSSSILLSRILLSIAPFFPTLFYSRIEQEDRFGECSSDLSFIAWGVTIFYAWCVLAE